MKKGKLLTTSIALILAGIGAVTTLSGCGGKDNPDDPTEEGKFGFSVALGSGKNQLVNGTTDKIVIYDNGVNTSGRSYKFYSTNPSLATIDENTGVITVNNSGKTGDVNFSVKEANTINPASLTRSVQVVASGIKNANGGFNFANSSNEAGIAKRTEILGKLEKYAMDSHLTGITLFDNGGFVRYNDRVKLGSDSYVTGYGFGLLTEGELKGPLYKPGTQEVGKEGAEQPDYLHSALSQDQLTINQYTATGSQVSDLVSYISSTYWSTKLDNSSESGTAWYPVLAADKIYPTEFKDGAVKIDNTKEKVAFNEPIPMEEANTLGMYKKWRVYVKTDGVNGVNLKFHQKVIDKSGSEEKLVSGPFDNQPITIDDYVFPYLVLLTGSNALMRGAEMANDTSYGIKGAARFFSDTQKIYEFSDIESKFNQAIADNKLGIKKGNDTNGDYIDIELINAIDSFTAMYTLSSSLVSPVPKGIFTGPKSVVPGSFYDSANNYGTFNGGDNSDILKYTVSCGPYTLEKWNKNSVILFQRNDDWFEVSQGRYKIPGVRLRILDSSSNPNVNWEEFEQGNLDSAGVPTSQVAKWQSHPSVKATKGDSTFKLNVNSCTQEQWDEKFGPKGTIHANSTWKVKPWMSNSSFLDGLFYSINRKEFADKRGVTPSVNYFSDSYMSDPKHSVSYNDTQAHKDAVKGYETITNGVSDYGYNYDKAVSCFRTAVNQLAAQGKIALGSKANPTTIDIHVKWMYQTDIKEYGNDIANYFTKAFNDDAVCGGKVKLDVVADEVSQDWQKVYDEMMWGQYDLGFGAISGNTYNPLNFMEVLKSDNSSEFTLNWGNNTSVVDTIGPIIFDDNPTDTEPAKAWSFDGLWEVADHGGVLKDGAKVKAVKDVVVDQSNFTKNGAQQKNLYEGFKLTLPVEFTQFDEDVKNVEFDVQRVDCYVSGRGNTTLGEKGSVDFPLTYNKELGRVTVDIPAELAADINKQIKDANGFEDTDKEDWHKNPFILSQFGSLFEFEVYYTITINGTSSENFVTVKM